MVTIITLNYNQNDFTVKCVESILQSKYNNFKLILIDNGSSEENYIKLKRLIPNDTSIEIHRLVDNRGYVGGINYGLEKAMGLNPEYIMIMNNDTILDKTAIRGLVETCKNFDNKAIATGKVYHYDEPEKFQDIGYQFSNKASLEFKRIGLNENDFGQYDEVSERDMLDDVFWLFPAKLYEEIGGYSPYFWFSAEQADFALRAKKKGYKLIYTPKAKLWHKGSVSLGGRNRNPKLAYWHTQSTLIFRYRHLSKIQFLNQYFKIFRSVITSYLKNFKEKIQGKVSDFQYANAKLSGFLYFNKWFFLRNNNKGRNPFNIKR